MEDHAESDYKILCLFEQSLLEKAGLINPKATKEEKDEQQREIINFFEKKIKIFNNSSTMNLQFCYEAITDMIAKYGLDEIKNKLENINTVQSIKKIKTEIGEVYQFIDSDKCVYLVSNMRQRKIRSYGMINSTLSSKERSKQLEIIEKKYSDIISRLSNNIRNESVITQLDEAIIALGIDEIEKRLLKYNNISSIGISKKQIFDVLSVQESGGKRDYIITSIDINKMVEKGILDSNLSEAEQDKKVQILKEQYLRILNNNYLSLSSDYNDSVGMGFINKMIDLFGIDETEKMLKIPKIISEKYILEQNIEADELLGAYNKKYELKGELQLVFSMLEKTDSYIARRSKNVKNDKMNFYMQLNKILDSDQQINFSDLMESCLRAANIEIDNSEIEKIKRSITSKQFFNKENEILNRINLKLDNPLYEIEQIGVSRTVLINVIKNNIFSDGTFESIEEMLNSELNRTREDGTLYYGESIIRQKDRYLQIINDLYKENEELLSCNIAENLRKAKNSITGRWIKKLNDSRKNVGSLDNLSEEQKEILLNNLTENGIQLVTDFDLKYELNPDASKEEIYQALLDADYRKLLTYEKAEHMFSSITEPYSRQFAKWFIMNKDEIMQNSAYYTEIATLHNEFDTLLKSSLSARTNFSNNLLTPELAFVILKNREKNNDSELDRLASEYNISESRRKKAREIFRKTIQREFSYIPQVADSKKKYRGRILRADDPMNIFAGNATNCCQIIGGEGQASMEHASTESNGRIFLVEEIDENGKVIKPVAQSWVWRNGDRICFDNIEIPVAEQRKLKSDRGDIEAQREILRIYQECAERMLQIDRKKLSLLLKKGEITEDTFLKLVLKEVTVGTGLSDLGVLEKSGLEVVDNIILPAEAKKRYSGKLAWIDSGGQDGEQLYLAKTEEFPRTDVEKYDLSDVPLLYPNEREVRKLKAGEIDKRVLENIKNIEQIVYRGKQKCLSNCESFMDIAKIYEMNPSTIQVSISRDNDWYMIYEERDSVFYIADVAMINGVNAQKQGGSQSTDLAYQTLEVLETTYELMLEAKEKGKKIRIEATEDTSYINIMNMVKKGLITIESDILKKWNPIPGAEYPPDEEDIMMHNMLLDVDKEKMEEELKKVKKRIEQRKEKRMLTKYEEVVEK